MPSLIGTTSGGISVAANYLKAVQSPGAALDGLNGTGTAPLLTFSTPNMRGYKVVITGVDITVTPEAADSDYSRVIRALQVTSELFAVFAPSVAGGNSTIVYMAPDFNTNPGVTTGDPVTGAETFSILEAAISGALAGAPTVAVTTSTCTGVTWS